MSDQSSWRDLESLWRAVLERGPTVPGIAALADGLTRRGLHDEGASLRRWSRYGASARARWSTWPFNGSLCTSSPHPPEKSEEPAIWFDVVSLVPFALIRDEDDDYAVWVATRPVSAWQFAAFCSRVAWRPFKSDFLSVQDLLAPGGRLPSDPRAPATRVYHEEACAFASWFGLVLTGEVELTAASEVLPPGQLDAVAPRGLRLWDGAEMPASEFLRLAWGQHTLDVDEGAEYIAVRDERLALKDSRILLHEWDAPPDVGFSLAWTAGQPMTPRTPPKRVFEFVELESLAPREQFPEEGLGA